MISQDDFLIRLMSVSDYRIMAKWLSDENVLKYYEEKLDFQVYNIKVKKKGEPFLCLPDFAHRFRG
jgi:hypothetical protein